MEVHSMTAVIDPHILRGRDADAVGRRVLGFLTQQNLALTPANFQLIFEVLSEGRPDLREAFLKLPKPIRQADLTVLARRFLAVCPELGKLKNSSAEAVTILTELRKALEAGTVVTQDAVADGDGSDLLSQVDAQVGQCLAALQAIQELLTPAVVEVPGQEHLTAQLSFGLGGYQALEDRIRELVASGISDQGLSLLLCRVEGLEPLERAGLGKVSDYMKNTLGRFSRRLIGKDDTAYWTAPDELGLLIGATSETYLAQLGEKLSRVVADAEGIARRSVKTLPAMVCRFGCARTHRPVPAVQLYGTARQSLQRAELTESILPVFAEVAADPRLHRRYEAIYGRRLR
jgi:diguanylate cyclase